MSRLNRAAQFMPFAALTGYGDAIGETARPVSERIEPGEDAVAEIDACLRLLQAAPAGERVAAVTYFVADEKKSGGAYRTRTDAVKTVDGYGRRLIFRDGETVAFRDILAIAKK